MYPAAAMLFPFFPRRCGFAGFSCCVFLLECSFSQVVTCARTSIGFLCPLGVRVRWCMYIIAEEVPLDYMAFSLRFSANLSLDNSTSGSLCCGRLSLPVEILIQTTARGQRDTQRLRTGLSVRGFRRVPRLCAGVLRRLRCPRSHRSSLRQAFYYLHM